VDQADQRPQAAGGERERRRQGSRDRLGRLRVAGREELPPAVGPLDDQVGFAAVPLAADDRNQPAGQGVMRRGDPDAFDLPGTYLLSLSAVVSSATSGAR
jgi:hypothetical protein